MARRASDRDPALDKAPEPEAPDPKAPDVLDGHPNEYIRVRHPNGNHYTTTRVLAHAAGATLLPNHPAVDKYGKPLPIKRKES